MKSFLLRMLYAALCVFIFWLVTPLFLHVIGLSLEADMTRLLTILIACLALVYVVFGPAPKAPWD